MEKWGLRHQTLGLNHQQKWMKKQQLCTVMNQWNSYWMHSWMVSKIVDIDGSYWWILDIMIYHAYQLYIPVSGWKIIPTFDPWNSTSFWEFTPYFFPGLHGWIPINPIKPPFFTAKPPFFVVEPPFFQGCAASCSASGKRSVVKVGIGRASGKKR